MCVCVGGGGRGGTKSDIFGPPSVMTTDMKRNVLYKLNEFELPHDKTNKMTVRQAKTQISLGICPV